MARELLCKWLKLPSHPWPPDHYTLLGLDPGQNSNDEVELRVLERMENLRHYQLLHPDAVTEGMNLLAQAMIGLTDPSARQDHDRDQGVESAATYRLAEPEEVEAEEESPAPPPGARTITWSNLAPPPPPSARREIEDPLPEPIVILELDDEPETDEDRDDAEPSLAIPRVILADEEKADADAAPGWRRGIYRAIVRVRRVLRAFERLQLFFDTPDKTFSRRTNTVAFMNALSDLRPLLETVGDWIGKPNEPGHLIAALSKQQLVVEMLRSFLPSQRDALAADCRLAHAVLQDHYRTLRADARRGARKPFKRRFVYPLYRHMAARPEWLFLFLGLLALAIAFVRSVPK